MELNTVNYSTHRERKEIYIKSLETEVLQLRTNEANLLQETRSLYGEIGQLKRLLTELGVQLPLEGANLAAPVPVDHESAAFPSNSVVSIRQGSKGPQIHVGHSAAGSRRRNDGFHLSANPPQGRVQRVFHKENSQATDVTSSFQSRKLQGILFTPSHLLITFQLPLRGCCHPPTPTDRHSLY